MNADKILFPTDFSPASEAVLPLATSLARDTGATLLILHVEEPLMVYGELSVGVPELHVGATQAMLERVTPTDSTVHCQRRMVSGHPATEIVRVAAEEGVDFIVMGTHGRSGLSRLLMGSVAELVVRHAGCPVLTFKHPAEKNPRVHEAVVAAESN